LSSYSKPLESFHIEKFRGLQDVKLEGLGQINLLVGVNNSGKTSVLEAIALYCSPLSLREWINVARQRDQENRLLSPLDALTWLFPHYSGLDDNELYKGEIRINSTGDFSIKKLLATCEVLEGIKLSSKEPINHQAKFLIDVDNSDLNKMSEEDNEVDEIQNGIRLLISIQKEHSFLNSNIELAIPKEFILWSNERITYKTSREEDQIVNQTITPFSHRTDRYPTKLFSQIRIEGLKPEVIKLLQL